MPKGSKVLLAATLGLVVLFGAGIAWVLGAVAATPDFTKLRGAIPVTVTLCDKKTKATRLVGPTAPGWVPLRQISNSLIAALIASEDTSFYSHDGIDMHELREAIKRDIEEKRWARGASTITQQVVKNLYLSQEKTITRKVRELLWARRIDRALSKQEILALYANLVEWGPNIYGIGEASRHFFGRSPSELTAKQSAFLAMLLPGPCKYYSYFKRKELTRFASGRIARILNVMKSMGFIDEATYEQARQESLFGEGATPELTGEPPAEDPIDKALDEAPVPSPNSTPAVTATHPPATASPVPASEPTMVPTEGTRPEPASVPEESEETP